ncbi:MAG TPA: hypothetical protein VFT87_02880, partial [Candidatus Saccharimonadales bacterium]|nr:hypothetical protein [Candidatus Saccharimonadales bacterium]
MTVPPIVRGQVDALLAMYAVYKTVSAQQAAASRQLARAKLKGVPAASFGREHLRITSHMQS